MVVGSADQGIGAGLPEEVVVADGSVDEVVVEAAIELVVGEAVVNRFAARVDMELVAGRASRLDGRQRGGFRRGGRVRTSRWDGVLVQAFIAAFFQWPGRTPPAWWPYEPRAATAPSGRMRRDAMNRSTSCWRKRTVRSPKR